MGKPYSIHYLSALIPGILLLIASSVALAQTVRYVTPTGTNTNPATATSWATATSDLQGAINASASGNQVWVAAGTYKPGGDANVDRSISFAMKEGVAIYGGFAGTENALANRPAINPVSGSPSSSTLSGNLGDPDLTTDNSYHILYNPALSNAAILDGFVITAANANGGGDNSNGGGMANIGERTVRNYKPTVRNCSFLANEAAGNGGGLYNYSFRDGSSPVLTNCLFMGNSATNGGAIYNAASESGATAPALTACSFRANIARGSGGAIYNSSNVFPSTTNPSITNCSFSGNSAAVDGGAMYNYGNGSASTNPVVTDCSFSANTAAGNGGAVYDYTDNNGNSSPTFTRCTFQANSAQSGGAMYNYGTDTGNSDPTLTNCSLTNNVASVDGGAMTNQAVDNGTCSPAFRNCSFLANTATGVGGGLYNATLSGSRSSPAFTNCSFQANSAGRSGGGMYNNGGGRCTMNVTLTNCVLFNNGGSATFVNTAGALSTVGITARYSLLDNTVTGVNVSGPGNLTTTTSPFVSTTDSRLSAGSPAVDMGNYAAYTTANGPATDLDGNTRWMGSAIDMGAYELFNALPVTLRYFNGRMTEAGALLGWATAREGNNAGFRIERSHDAVGFEVIANVPSQALNGDSGTPLTYTYTDALPLPGVNYYRLVQTDHDGARSVSKVIALSNENQPPVLYPNPVGTLGEATLEPAIAYVRYELVDMLGRVCQQASMPGTLSRLSVGTLPAGVYLLRVQTEGAGQQVFRLVR